MKDRYQAIVIGTGFGGAVAACRLAQAGIGVGVFERGHRYPPAAFPRGLKDAPDGWVWQLGRGLFDIRILSEMTAVSAAGYGGGSLVYANVQMRPPREVFASGWPHGYSLEALADYYDLVAYMLDIKPITDASAMPPKTIRMKEAAAACGRAQQLFHPNLAINFGATGKNRFGAQQQGCNFCGECIIGCPSGAKNSLDLNYLKAAEERGADINTDCEVIKIEPLTEGGGYRVIVRDHQHDIQAACEGRHVFVCAGSINSTELLLRCRDEYKTLDKLNPLLGHRYSGNGDFLAFAFDTASAFEPSNGPTITSAVLYDRRSDQPAWFVLEDGGYPRELSALVDLLHPKAGFLEEVDRVGLLERARAALADRTASAAVDGERFGAPERTGVFLLMGRDRANGVMRLNSPAPGICIEWDVASNLPLYDIEAELSADFAKSLGGRLAVNPLWKMMRVPVSVHNLGGCPMGMVEGEGVVDAFGEVFEYPGLYVLDGSILPAATGANPSHTIAAVAERNVEAAIRKIRNLPGWRAPEMDAALQHRAREPLDEVVVPQGGTALPSTPPVVLSFTETLRGFFSFGTAQDYETAERDGREACTSAAITLTITTPALDSFLIDKRHTASAQGIVKVAGLTGSEGAAVRNGVFNLFVAGRDGDCYRRRMLYHLPFRGADGKDYVLDGFKDIRDHGGFDVWSATTTLYTSVRAADGTVAARGIIRTLLPDFLKQLATFRISGTDSVWVKTTGMARFFRLFLGTLYDVFARPSMPGAV